VTLASSGFAARDVLSFRCDLLFTHDAKGRMLRARETDGAIAPRFYLGRGPLYNVWRFRADLPEALTAALARLVGKERALPVAAGRLESDPPWPAPERMEAFRRLLREHGEIAHEYRGPAFRFPDVIQDAAAPQAPGELVRLAGTPQVDRALQSLWADSTDASVAQPGDSSRDLLDSPDLPDLRDLSDRSDPQPETDCFAIVRGGSLVSACWTSRFLPGIAAEAGVETRGLERGQGHAARVVSAWASAMRQAGVEPLYSTEWSNAASRAVARKLGLVPNGEDLHFG
jgi:hypothetical protein